VFDKVTAFITFSHSAISSIQFKAENALMNTRVENAILVQDLRKKYGDAEVLKGVNQKIEKGEFYALMGPNGSRKTTLTSIIASVGTPTSGSI